MEWISLKEKLPPFDVRIAVYVYYESDAIEYCNYCIMIAFFSFERGFIIPEKHPDNMYSFIEPLMWCEIPFPDQPDRSKREDSFKMRCGTQNTDDKSVREVQ